MPKGTPTGRQVSQQRERQIILLDERFVGFFTIDADAKDFDVELAKRLVARKRRRSDLGEDRGLRAADQVLSSRPPYDLPA